MGLDMYLECKFPVTQDWLASTHQDKKVTYLIQEVGYWRKANAVHGWFVRNVQDGKDDMREYYVPEFKLRQLRNACRQALMGRATSSIIRAKSFMPPTSGFFFGPARINEGYWTSLEQTVTIVSEALEFKPDGGVFIYSSSW